MEFLTNEKLTIVGAAGMIGSNMAQTALMMHLTPNVCLYDPYAPALEGVAEELRHCAFKGVNLTYTSDVKEALTGAAYVVSSGGAARKAGMTREDLLKGNAEIAAEFGKNLRAYCPDVKHVVVIFNPADITGLIVRRLPLSTAPVCKANWPNISMPLPTKSRIAVPMAVMASRWLSLPRRPR